MCGLSDGQSADYSMCAVVVWPQRRCHWQRRWFTARVASIYCAVRAVRHQTKCIIASCAHACTKNWHVTSVLLTCIMSLICPY